LSTLLSAASAVGGSLAKARGSGGADGERNARSASPYQLASPPRKPIDWEFV
jgi:hypothetical protein